jgi:predicted permease
LRLFTDAPELLVRMAIARRLTLETLLQDIRFGFRTLLKNKGFSIVAIVTLALAIGANTAIFTIVNSVILRGLPVENNKELVILGDPTEVHGRHKGSLSTDAFSYPLFQELSKESGLFSGLYAAGDVRRLEFSLSPSDERKPANGRFVTGKYFSILGVRPLIGRTFLEQEADVNHPAPVAVISYAFWQRQFAASSGVINQTIYLKGVPVTIIGVTPRDFEGEVSGESQDIWVPMSMQSQLVPGKDWVEDPRVGWLQVMGRLQPGVTRQQAEAQLNVKIQQLADGPFGAQLTKQDRDDFKKNHLAVSAGARGFSWARDTFARPMILLMIIVGLVLVMACTNISNMLLARSSSRSREIALRVAIGASPWRVVRQLVTESLLLTFIGGVAGLAVAQWGTQLLLRWVGQRYSSLVLDTTPDARVLLFALGLCFLTGILFGLFPAVRALRVELTSILGQSARGSAGYGFGRTFSVGNLLVAAQFAVSMLVIAGAAMLVRSLYNLEDVDLGYPREHLIVVKTDPLSNGLSQERLRAMAVDVTDALATVPGVQKAAVSVNGLFSGTESDTSIEVEGYKTQNEEDLNSAMDQVGPGYFSTIGATLLLGREFDVRDMQSGATNVIVNESFAQFYFKDANPIGRKLMVPDNESVKHPLEIIGVVRDVRDHSIRKKVDRRFYLTFNNPVNGIAVLNYEIRTNGDPNLVMSNIRQRMTSVAPNLPILSIKTVDEMARRTVFEESMLARLSSLFGILALLLAAVGIYGLMSYLVAVRTKEIGIRLALGAQPGDILRSVLKQSVVLAGTGVLVGIPIVLLCGRAMRTVLYEVGAGDPFALVSSVVILASVAVLASLLPARSAMKVDPIHVLRYE